MPPVRTNKHKTRPGPYDNTRPPQCEHPPRTPREFLEMIKAHPKAILVQLSQDRTSHTACKNCCNTIVKTTPVHNKLGNRVDERTPLLFWRHQAFQLSSLVMLGSKVSREHLTDVQIKAIDDLNDKIEDQSENALLKRLGHPDAQCVKEWEMERLIILFTTIFFQTTQWDKMEVKFAWGTWPSEPGRMGDCTCPGPGLPYALVRMSAREVRPFPDFKHLNGRTMSRLSTLLHELVHAYIGYYACPCCLSYEEDVFQLGGHGRAWHRIARSVELFAARILDLPLELCRFDAIINHWEDTQIWPTLEEAKGWGLKWR